MFESSPTDRHSLHADRTAVRLAEVAAGKQFLQFQTRWARSWNVNRPPVSSGTSALPHATTVYQFGRTQRGTHPPGPLPAGHFVMRDCALTADHRFVAGRRAPSDAWFSLCDLATETVAARLSFPAWVPADQRARFAFSRDETRAVVATLQVVAVFNLPPPKPLTLDPLAVGALVPTPGPLVSPSVTIRVTQPQPDATVAPFAVLPCGRRALVRGEKSRVELRDLTTGEVLTVWKWGLPRVNALAVAGDGLTAAAGGAGGRVVMWDLE